MLITITSANAGQRPLAGFGMGACFSAAPRLPRVKRAVAAISECDAPASAGIAGYPASVQTKTKLFNAQQVEAQQFEAQQFEHVTRVIPAYRGGVGSHPAREPEPV